MSFWTRIFGGSSPRAATQSAGGGMLVTTSQQLEEVMRGGAATASGVRVTPDSAMRVAAVHASIRIISGAVANMPIDIVRKVSSSVREEVDSHAVARLFAYKPNGWMKPAAFKRMLQVHLMLRGNAYAMIIRSRGQIIGLVPLHPDRVECRQNDDLSLSYTYQRKDGGRIELEQREVFHLVGLTLDGVTGVSMLTYARETIGESIAAQDHGASVFKNGARVSNVLTHPSRLGKEGLEFLRASLDEYRAGGESEGKSLILEEGMDVSPLSMTSIDAQWIEARKFGRTDIAMFFGVPPHMLGDTEKSTSWGTGIEQQSIGFVTWTLEDHLTMWEETITVDLLADPSLRAKFNRSALVKGDIKARWEAHTKALQWGVVSPDEVRAKEDMNPRPDGQGGQFYPPPNTAGSSSDQSPPDGSASNDPSQPA